MIADAANSLDAASTQGYLLVLAIVVPVGGVLIATAVGGRTAERTAFAAEIAASAIAPHAHFHFDAGAPEQKLDTAGVLAAPSPDKRLYVCGPAGFIDHVVNKKAEIVRVYLPPDANTLLVIADHCLKTWNRVNVIVAGKQPEPQWLTMEEAEAVMASDGAVVSMATGFEVACVGVVMLVWIVGPAPG